MKLHSNATTCQHSRELLVRRVLEQRWTLARAAEAAGVRVRTVSKWLRPYRAEGEAGVADRHSEPKRIANRVPELWARLLVEEAGSSTRLETGAPPRRAYRRKPPRAAAPSTRENDEFRRD